MIRGMATLLGFQLAGELTARLGHLPISGPICGMAALLAWFHLKGEVESELSKVCDAILDELFGPVRQRLAGDRPRYRRGGWRNSSHHRLRDTNSDRLDRSPHRASGRSGAAVCEPMTVGGYGEAITGDCDVTNGPF